MFEHKTEINPDGYYYAWVWPKEVPKKVVVDDYFVNRKPTNDSFSPLFARQSFKEPSGFPFWKRYGAR